MCSYVLVLNAVRQPFKNLSVLLCICLFLRNRREVLYLVEVDGNSSVDALFEADEGFSCGDTWYVQNAVVEQFHQVLVVARIEFDEHGVTAGGEMTFHHFSYFL